MRRKGDRTKDKEKTSPDKKLEKAIRRSRRHSRRRKRSSSPSDHEESAEENEVSVKGGHEDTEDERGKASKEESNLDTDAKEKDSEENSKTMSRVRRSSKKQGAEGSGASKIEAESPGDDDWKEDRSFWEGDEDKVDASESRHKEKDGKSSVWQVKSSNDSGSSGGGEIQRIKLCIVRPSESSTDPSPRRRKRLSRSTSSHKDKADLQECEEPEEEKKLDVSEVQKGEDPIDEPKRSCESPNDEKSRSPVKECELEESASHQSPCEGRSSAQGSPVEETAVQEESREREGAPESVPSEEKQNDQDTNGKQDETEEQAQVKDESSEEQCTAKESSEEKKEETEEERKKCEMQPGEVKEVVSEEKDNQQTSSEEQSGTEMIAQISEVEVTPKEEENERGAQEEMVENDKEKAGDDLEEAKKTVITSPEEGDVKKETPMELNTSAVRRKSASSCEDGSEETREVQKEESPDAERVDNSSPNRTKVINFLEEGQTQDSSEENSASQDVSGVSSKGLSSQVNQSVRESSNEKSNKQIVKRVFVEERSPSRDSSEERSREDIKKRRQSRESNSSRSYSTSPGKQSHRRSDRDSNRHSRQESERSDKHRKREGNRSSSPDKQGSRHSNRRSRSPQHRREKISLRRSFSRRSDSHSGEKRDEGSSKNVESSTDDSHPHIKDDKENVRKSTEQSGSSLEQSQSVTRRRRWGASKTNRPGKKPVLSISTDSLKNLIPGAKPVPVSEVQLSQEEEERRERESDEPERDESDKREKSRNKERDNQETDKKSVAPMTVSEPHKISVAVTDDHRGKAVTRKISIVSDDARTLQNSPSPPRHKASNVLFISNLVRPFTVNQLKELLARTGTIVEGGFWIDKIKSKCYVQYETETEARETRHALHGVRWPVSNPKQLCVDFGKKEDMDLAQALTEEDQIPRKTEPLKVERTVEGWVAEQVREKEREQEMRERERERERERARIKERPHHVMPSMETLERNRNVKMSASVREWDLGKIGQLSPNEREPRHEEKNKDREKRTRREKAHHSRTPSPHDIPARKQKKKEEDAPAKLLDDLFRKTKSTPCIYWLPLTAEQIVVKEEMRRRHMAEHERRMAEMRKAERERERVRAQQRQQRRTGERDKRRRRTTSGSPKK